MVKRKFAFSIFLIASLLFLFLAVGTRPAKAVNTLTLKPSTTHKAYFYYEGTSVSSDRYPCFPEAKDNWYYDPYEFDSYSYSYVQTSDNNYATANYGANTLYLYFGCSFKFNISAVINLTKYAVIGVSLTWKGYLTMSSATLVYARIQINTTSGWQTLGSFGTTDQSYTFSNNNYPNQWLVNGWIKFGAHYKLYSSSQSGFSCIYVDFVQITVTYEPIGTPTVSPSQPASGALFTPSTSCTFVWSFSDKYNASDYQTAFRLQIDDDPDFWTPNIDTGKVSSSRTNTTIVLPSTSGYYYWRVMVWDSQDFPSDWTAGRLIVVGYKYVLNGAYYENGAKTSFAVTVTAYFEELQADQFSLNGTVTKLYDKKPTVFVFNFGAASRSWYVRDNVENITVFAPYDTVSLYTFTIQDYAGIIGNNTYFQVDSFINNAYGTMTITRVKATGQVTVPLQVGRSYLLRLVGDGWTYDFKLFIASSLTSETLTTKPVFEDRVKLAYKYILADASRDNSSITVKYQDNLKSTLWVYLKIRLTNGTVVYASNVTGLNLVQWVYPLSDNNTLGYWVELTINHASLGSLSYTKALPPTAGRTSPWDLSPLGSFPIPANQVFGVFIVLVFAGLFSTLNAEYGIVLVCMVAGILYLLGWLNISAAILAFAMSLAVLYALGRRHIQT